MVQQPPTPSGQGHSALTRALHSLLAWIATNPKNALIISLLSIILNFTFLPAAWRQYLKIGGSNNLTFRPDVIECRGSHNPPEGSGVVSIDFNGIPNEALAVAKHYITQLGLCVRAAQKEEADGSFEILLADNVSIEALNDQVAVGDSIVEMDIVKEDDNTYEVQEIERQLSWNFVLTEKDLEPLRAMIVEKCNRPESSLIELSERDPSRRPGYVLRDEDVYYEFECTAKVDGSEREYEMDFMWTLTTERKIFNQID